MGSMLQKSPLLGKIGKTIIIRLQNNLKTLNKAFEKQNLFNYFIPESTYLLWLNCSKLKPENYFLKKVLGYIMDHCLVQSLL